MEHYPFLLIMCLLWYFYDQVHMKKINKNVLRSPQNVRKQVAEMMYESFRLLFLITHLTGCRKGDSKRKADGKLRGCQCCPDTQPTCSDETCNGDNN